MADQGGTSGAGSRTRIVAAVVVSVLVTTSAAGAVGAVAELSDPNSSVVKQLTTDAANETTQPQFPPGTNESGVTNATALLRAHSRVLQNTTYTARVTVEGDTTSSGSNDSATEQSELPFTVAVEKGVTGTNVGVLAAGDRVEYWITENATVTRNAHSRQNVTTTTYRYEENGTFGLSGYYASIKTAPTDAISPYVAGLDYTYQGTVTRGNDTLHRFTSTGIHRSADSAIDDRFPSNVENTSATLLVSERGVIRQLDATVQYTRNNQTVTTRLRYSVDHVGNTTTSEPAWLAAQLPRFDASVTENGRVIALEYTGGPDIANGTQSPTGVFVSMPSGEAYTQFNASLSPGDTVYLWNASRTPELNSSVNDPPRVNESFTTFGGERVSVTVARFQFRPGVDGAAKSVVMLELRVTNETATAGGTTAPDGTTASNETTTPNEMVGRVASTAPVA